MLFTMLKIFNILLWLSISSCASINADDKKELETTIDKYFIVWSNGDMKAYKNAFHELANIQYITKFSNEISTESLDSFVEGQTTAIRFSKEKLKEVPLSKNISIQGKTAHAIVKWKLYAGKKETTGYDHFIFVKTAMGWKILYLYFYEN